MSVGGRLEAALRPIRGGMRKSNRDWRRGNDREWWRGGEVRGGEGLGLGVEETGRKSVARPAKGEWKILLKQALAALTLVFIAIWIASGWYGIWIIRVSTLHSGSLYESRLIGHPFQMGVAYGAIRIQMDPTLAQGTLGWEVDCSRHPSVGSGLFPSFFSYFGLSSSVWWIRQYQIGSITGVDIPMWLFVVGMLVPTVWLFFMGRKNRTGFCARCGYDLTGNQSGVCPECGVATAESIGKFPLSPE